MLHPEHGFLAPTNTCFDDVKEILANLIQEYVETDFKNFNPIVCHGICIFPSKYSHAWVTHNDLAFDLRVTEDDEKFLMCYQKKDFIKQWKVTEYTEYTPIEIMEKALANDGYCGPFEKKYIKLCNEPESKIKELLEIF